MHYRTPQSIASACADRATVDAAGLRPAERWHLAARAEHAKLQELAQGIAAGNYRCARPLDDGRFEEWPLDDALRQELAEFLRDSKPADRPHRRRAVISLSGWARAVEGPPTVHRQNPIQEHPNRAPKAAPKWQDSVWLLVGADGEPERAPAAGTVMPDSQNGESKRRTSRSTADKAAVQTAARILWQENPELTYGQVAEHPHVALLANGNDYNLDTIIDWLSEMPDSPRKGQRGRPRKTPAD